MKKKITQLRWLAALLLLVAAMVMPSVAWAQITLTQPSVGDGSANKPYQISNKYELYWFAGLVNGTLEDVTQNASAWAVLTADIEVSEPWTPIIGYEGTFDGKGHTISGLKLEAVDVGCPSGLFGPTQNSSVIRNVGIVNCEFGVTIFPVGGVCGENNGTIENCYTTGSIKSGSNSNGGCVCGYNKGTIMNCYNTGKVDGNPEQVGGVCGLNEGTIENCYYLSDTAAGGIFDNSGTGSAEVKTAAQFMNGEVAWLLNGSTSEGTEENPLAWYQYLNGDSYPVLDSSQGTVYRGYKCLELTYSNNPDELSENPVHNYDKWYM